MQPPPSGSQQGFGYPPNPSFMPPRGPPAAWGAPPRPGVPQWSSPSMAPPTGPPTGPGGVSPMGPGFYNPAASLGPPPPPKGPPVNGVTVPPTMNGADSMRPGSGPLGPPPTGSATVAPASSTSAPNGPLKPRYAPPPSFPVGPSLQPGQRPADLPLPRPQLLQPPPVNPIFYNGGSSEASSAQSSRVSTPLPTQRYDQLEGQFSESSSGHNTPSRPAPVPPHMWASMARNQSTGSLPASGMIHPFTPSMAPPPPAPPTGPPSGPPTSAGNLGNSGLSAARRVYPTQQFEPPKAPVAPPAAAPPMQQPMQQPSGQMVNQRFEQMQISSPAHSGGDRVVDLLKERHILPPQKDQPPRASLPGDLKHANCSPEIFRCTVTAIPQTAAILSKCRLPLGILIHPFKDLSQLPVIQSTVIVRCRSCRTYINPFVSFVDSSRWRCNLCYRINEIPDDFLFDPQTKSYGDPSRRPEIRSATIEFIAPQEYALRPPQPAVYCFLLDVSFNAVETGYLKQFSAILEDVLEQLPGDKRTLISFIAYDSAVHFFNLQENLSQPQMLTVPDIDDIFLPMPDYLLANLQDCQEMVSQFVQTLPTLFAGTHETNSALGAALEAAFKLMSAHGGRLTVFQTMLPNVGPGALKSREDPNERAAKDVENLAPANDFYKKLALECCGQQIAVDLFLLSGRYADLATLSCVSKYSGGEVKYYPAFHAVNNRPESERFERDLRRYLTRKIGFEAVMRVRCTKGLNLHTFHGNFFVRSTDLLALPNVNPDAGYAMQISIEEGLTETDRVCFQAALLYTSSRGERRIRVHTLCLPVTTNVSDIYAGADTEAIVGLVAKMAVDRTMASSLHDAREAMYLVCSDFLTAFGATLTSSQKMGALYSPPSLRLLPLYMHVLTRNMAFRVGASTKLDERVFAMCQCKSMPLAYLMLMVHPNMYALHTLNVGSTRSEENSSDGEDEAAPGMPPLLPLSAEVVDRRGAYLLDTGERMYLWVGTNISENFCSQVLGVPSFASVTDQSNELPELENPYSLRVRRIVSYLLEQRSFHAPLVIVREDSRHRSVFLQYLHSDRVDSSDSYYEFVQKLYKQVCKA